MRKQLYKDLKDRLNRLIIGQNGAIEFVGKEFIEEQTEAGNQPEKAIKHIALWNRQVEFIEQETPFLMPAVFIEFGKAEWRHQSGGIQDAELAVGLHVLTMAMPEGWDAGEFHLDLLDSINTCLHGFCGEDFSSFQRTASIPCHDHEEILDDTEVFKVMVYDRTAAKKTVKRPTPPDVTMQKG